VSLLRPSSGQRLARALIAFVWLAHQLGFAAHGAMQVRSALAGGSAEICTSAGLARAPVDLQLPAPSDHEPTAGNVCDLCTTTTLPALATAPLQTRAAPRSGPASKMALSTPSANDFPKRAHQSRAPPAQLS
jgi:hypothetical protein